MCACLWFLTTGAIIFEDLNYIQSTTDFFCLVFCVNDGAEILSASEYFSMHKSDTLFILDIVSQ